MEDPLDNNDTSDDRTDPLDNNDTSDDRTDPAESNDTSDDRTELPNEEDIVDDDVPLDGDADADLDESSAISTAILEELPGGGYRVTRRTTRTRRTLTTEDIEERIEERLPASAYRAGGAGEHPPAVG